MCVIAHYGKAGHHRVEATTTAILSKFYWPEFENDVIGFCQKCLHCIGCLHAEVSRPLGEAIQAEERNQVLQYDFLVIKDSDAPETTQRILVITDDLSYFVELISCGEAKALLAPEALLDWYKRLGLGLYHVSDQGTHFKNEIISELNLVMQTEHHFVIPYIHQANGTMERVYQGILKVLKSLLSELRVSQK